MNIADALRAMIELAAQEVDALSHPRDDDETAAHETASRQLDDARAALAAHDASVSAGGWYVNGALNKRGNMVHMRRIIGSNNGIVADLEIGPNADGNAEFAAARIVQCVNAMQGIADPAALVAAARSAQAWIGQYEGMPGHDAAARSMLNVLRDALKS